MRDALQCIFCVCKANLSLTPLLFNFVIHTGVTIAKNEFEKDNFFRGMELIFQRLIWKIWLMCDFLVPGGSKGMQLTASTCCGHVTEQEMHKKWLAIRFFPWDYRTCPCQRTWLGHGLETFSMKKISQKLVK